MHQNRPSRRLWKRQPLVWLAPWQTGPGIGQKSSRPGDAAQAQGYLAECLIAQKRYAEAEPLLIDSYQALKTFQVPTSPVLREARERLASLYAAWGKPSASIP